MIEVMESFVEGEWLATCADPKLIGGGPTPDAARADLEGKLARQAQVRANVADRLTSGSVL